jgi:peptidoglycan-associated lipoprotein
MRLRWLLLPSVFLAACAHEQVAQAPAQPIVAQPAAPVADATPQAKADDTAELKRLLTGPIAHFDFDQARLTDQDREKLQTLAKALKAHPAARIRIAGNCDELGTEEYNLALGQRRAEVARKYLTDLGITPSRLETISYGENRPAVEGHDEAAHAANRRDEAELLSTR